MYNTTNRPRISGLWTNTLLNLHGYQYNKAMRKHLLFWLVAGLITLSLLLGMLLVVFDKGCYVGTKTPDQLGVTRK